MFKGKKKLSMFKRETENQMERVSKDAAYDED
jgi:hypothetical protein